MPANFGRVMHSYIEGGAVVADCALFAVCPTYTSNTIEQFHVKTQKFKNTGNVITFNSPKKSKTRENPP